MPLTSFISRLKINHCGVQVIKKMYTTEKLTPNPSWFTGCRGDYPSGAILISLWVSRKPRSSNDFRKCGADPKKWPNTQTDPQPVAKGQAKTLARLAVICVRDTWRHQLIKLTNPAAALFAFFLSIVVSWTMIIGHVHLKTLLYACE